MRRLFLSFPGLAAVAWLCLMPRPAFAQGGFWDFANSLFGTQQQAAPSPALSALSQSDIGAALREALTVSADKVVARVGKEGGFSRDPKIRIPLPPALQPVDRALKAVGMGALTADLEERINKAAEAAAPKAKEIFVGAIRKMTIEDARQILSGPDDAATAYLKKHMTPELLAALQPVVADALAQAGAVKAYDAVRGQQGQAVPFIPDAKANLSHYAAQKTVDGIFFYMAQEESAIRKEPAKRTTELMKKVFSAVQ